MTIRIRLKRYWWNFHDKHIRKIKFRFVLWFHNQFPGKYCWTDCVYWSLNPRRFNPFKIDSSSSCELESYQHSTKACYCGGWMAGKCWFLLSKEEQQRIKDEAPVSEGLPF